MNATSLARRAPLALASLCLLTIACDDERVVTLVPLVPLAPASSAPAPASTAAALAPAAPVSVRERTGHQQAHETAHETSSVPATTTRSTKDALASALAGTAATSQSTDAMVLGGVGIAGGTGIIRRSASGNRDSASGSGVGRGSGGSGMIVSRGASGASYGASAGAAIYGAGAGALGGVTRTMEPPPPRAGGTFVHAGTNPVVDAREDRLSTFAIDVDTGSWLYARRFLQMGRRPEAASVRVEELVNAMHYDYAGPSSTSDAFAILVDAAPSPFTRGHHIVRVALQGRRVETSARKAAHVTFLVDVSGSMAPEDRLPWARDAIRTAVAAMREDDTVAIATYAGHTRLALRATRTTEREDIERAIATLVSGGGTNMGSGMELAYREANQHLGSERSARVIVLSDGDANIGRTGHAAILRSIAGYVSEGVTLSTVGFGTGNYNDHLMEQLADAGNGTYTYIGDRETLRRVFADELTQTLEVIAQDAKIQVEWNADVVASYRLLGYENRAMADQDFRNDKKDAGEIGAGHAVTALYEVRLVDPARTPDDALGTVRVRHKLPRASKAHETARSIDASLVSDGALDANANAALGMALAAEILRGSDHARGLSLVDAAALLRKSAVGKHAKERGEAAALFEQAASQAVAVR